MTRKRTLLYLFRGKVESEEIGFFQATARAQQLFGCTQSTIYMISADGTLKNFEHPVWVTSKDVPNEVKLAVMLVN